MPLSAAADFETFNNSKEKRKKTKKNVFFACFKITIETDIYKETGRERERKRKRKR